LFQDIFNQINLMKVVFR